MEVDFENQSFRDELRKAGFRERRKTFFVWEGVSMYLTRSSVRRTLAALHTMSAAGSRVVLDLWYLPDEHDLMAAARRFSSNLLALLGEPVTFGIHPEDVTPFFQRLGFRVDDLAGADKLHKLYFKRRGPIYPTSYLVHAVARRMR